MLIHQASDVFVLEGFALHDMAPVAGRVANAEQNWFIFPSCLLQGLLAPRIPIYRVVCVLLQIWTRLIDEPVCMLVLLCICAL